jgi:HD-like signal output (HDOD) protein
VLATRFRDEYEAMLAYRRAHDCTIVVAEQAVLGIDHTVVGSALTAYWKFPLEMQRAVAAHHTPDECAKNPLSLVVHAANTLAHALDLGGDSDDLAPPISHAVWEALGLDEAQSTSLFAEIETTFNEMCQILVS